MTIYFFWKSKRYLNLKLDSSKDLQEWNSTRLGYKSSLAILSKNVKMNIAGLL